MNSGLYIHVPFCITRCAYCSFYSTTKLELQEEWKEALLKEISLELPKFESFDTLYFGGGTPSSLKPTLIEPILSALNLESLIESTIEVNPDDISKQYAQSLYSLGFNRISMGIQSSDDKLLSLMQRRHTFKQAQSAYDNLRKAGFDNISLDLISCLPNQNIATELENLLQLDPEHISCYQLTLEPNTHLAKAGIKLPSDDQQAEIFEHTSQILSDAGYKHYEVSNFSKPRLESKHNLKYWNHTPYLGLGPSAHSFLNSKRWYNQPSLTDYLKRHPKTEEILTMKDLAFEELFLGLRTSKGVRKSLLKKNHALHSLIKNGFLTENDETYSPTTQGMLIADTMAIELSEFVMSQEDFQKKL